MYETHDVSAEPLMKRREFFHGLPCLEHLPHRGFRIGNIMIGIAVTAVGLSSISRPDLTGRERLFLGMFTVAFLGLLWAQWGVASMSCIAARPRSWRSRWLRLRALAVCPCSFA